MKKYFYTFELLELLQSMHPSYEFVFCMGYDLLSTFNTWDNHEELISKYEFIILKRPEFFPDEKLFPPRNRILNTVIDGSSTKIRNRITKKHSEKKLNLGINGLTTNSVIQYILENKLYSQNLLF